ILFQAEDGIRDFHVTGVQTCALPISWEGLHEWLRNAIQALIQEALEAEVTELLGRVRYQRRAAVDAPAGYRNGYGKPRKLTTPKIGRASCRRRVMSTMQYVVLTT